MVSLTDIVGGSRGGDTPAAQLRLWEDMLCGRGSVKHFLLVVMYSNLSWVVPPLFACTAVRTAVSPDVPSILKGVCGLSIMYSSGSTAFLLAKRRLRVVALFTEARRLCESVEGFSSSKALEAGAAAIRQVRVLGFIYIKCGCFMATVEQFTDAPAIPRCVEPEQRWARMTSAFLESAKWTYLATCFFSFWMMVLTLLLAVEGQYALLCERLTRARGHADLASCASHFSRIQALENAMRVFYFNALLHVLAGALLVPLVNTYEFVSTKTLAVFTILTMSTLPLVYGTMSLLGDRLVRGASRVGLSAYSGDWLSEPAHTRCLRLLFMQTSMRAAPFAMSGLGEFRRSTAYGVLRTWYQYLNLLIGCMA